MYTHIRSANYVFSHYLPLWFIVFGHFALSSETLFNLTYLIVATTRTYIFIIWILNVFFAYWAPVQAHSFPVHLKFLQHGSGIVSGVVLKVLSHVISAQSRIFL